MRKLIERSVVLTVILAGVVGLAMIAGGTLGCSGGGGKDAVQALETGTVEVPGERVEIPGPETVTTVVVKDYLYQCQGSDKILGERSLKMIKGIKCDLLATVNPLDLLANPTLQTMLNKIKEGVGSDAKNADMLEWMTALAGVTEEVTFCGKMETTTTEAGETRSDLKPLVMLGIAAKDVSYNKFLSENISLFGEYGDVINQAYNGKINVINAEDGTAILGEDTFFIFGAEAAIKTIKAGGTSLADDSKLMEDMRLSRASTLKAVFSASLNDVLKDASVTDEAIKEINNKIKELFGFTIDRGALLLGLSLKDESICSEIVGAIDGDRTITNLTLINTAKLKDLDIEKIIEAMAAPKDDHSADAE